MMPEQIPVRHFEEELDDLQGRLLEMAGLVETAVRHSVQAVADRDESYAQEVFKNETRVNRLQIEIDEFATRLLALQQPMARDLRFLTAAIKINSDLERMGDLAVNIAERSISLIQKPELKPLIDIPAMAALTQGMVRDALDSFVNRDPDLARKVLLADDAVDQRRDLVCEELIDFMERDPATIRRGFDLIAIARNLERIADHATNIAEDVLFLIRGIDVRHHAEG
jgi:phosphate transport system protein